jgi:hypothetical protein
VLQSEVVTDPNGNTSRVHFNPIGLVEQIWVRDKSGGEGDAQHPSVEMSYDFLAFERSGQPICVRTLRHERHDTDPDYTASATIEAREYSDGFGRLLQTRTQAEDVLFGDATFGANVLPLDPATAPGSIPARQRAAGDAPNVVVSGWQVYDHKGRVVEKYEPYFDRGWDYVAPAAGQLGAKVTMYYDPRGQVIRTARSNGSSTGSRLRSTILRSRRRTPRNSIPRPGRPTPTTPTIMPGAHIQPPHRPTGIIGTRPPASWSMRSAGRSGPLDATGTHRATRSRSILREPPTTSAAT